MRLAVMHVQNALAFEYAPTVRMPAAPDVRFIVIMIRSVLCRVFLWHKFVADWTLCPTRNGKVFGNFIAHRYSAPTE